MTDQELVQQLSTVLRPQLLCKLLFVFHYVALLRTGSEIWVELCTLPTLVKILLLNVRVSTCKLYLL